MALFFSTTPTIQMTKMPLLSLPSLHLHQGQSRHSTKMTKLPLSRAVTTKASYELKEGQKRHFHLLPSGLKLEVIEQEPISPLTAAAAVFVHGSFHAAWCWAEHYMPLFSSEAGIRCYSISLLAQGESDVPNGEKLAGTLETHASHIADFIRNQVEKPPILIGHSFGGLIVQFYLSNLSNPQISGGNVFPKLAGAVLVCSVPPTGNNGLVWRYLLTKPIAAFKVTLSLAAKAFMNDLSLCKETFFSSKMEDQLVLKYQELMKESSKLPLFDLRKLNASLPMPKIKNNSINLLVMGASNDFIVDEEGLKETAKFYDVEAIFVHDVAHDMMIDFEWKKGAQIILSWIQNLGSN
ncbi:hypothetical protein LUZ60_012724 [Juncus effusus]|nr:hypothetical protein LUZ60_012724 [Juncus effusus]